MAIAAAAILAMLLARIAWADLCAVKDLGLIPNDPTVDNGAIWSAAIRDGKITDTVHFPGGAYWAKTTADCGRREGLAIEGQGLALWNNNVAYDDKNTITGRSSVRWIYTGPASQPAWRFSGVGCSMRGINIWRGYQWSKWDKVPWSLEDRWGERDKAGNWTAVSTAVELTRVDPGPPAGSHSFEKMNVSGFGRAFWMRKSSNNVDGLLFTDIYPQFCREGFYCDNRQTSGLTLRHIRVTGDGETIFNFQCGGNLSLDGLFVEKPRLIFAIKGDTNTSTFRAVGVKIDNNAKGWRLVDSSGPLNLTVRGHIGNEAEPAADAINVRPYVHAPPTTDIKLRRWGGDWPWPRVEGAK